MPERSSLVTGPGTVIKHRTLNTNGDLAVFSEGSQSLIRKLWNGGSLLISNLKLHKQKSLHTRTHTVTQMTKERKGHRETILIGNNCK